MLTNISALLSRLIHGAERHRAYTYRAAVTIGAALVAGGQLTAGHESALLTLLGAVLGVGGSGLAAVNSSTKRPDPVAADLAPVADAPAATDSAPVSDVPDAPAPVEPAPPAA